MVVIKNLLNLIYLVESSFCKLRFSCWFLHKKLLYFVLFVTFLLALQETKNYFCIQKFFLFVELMLISL